MKKLLPKLALLALPFLLYAVLFFVFEPYDYFGFKGGAANEDSMLTRVKSYLAAPTDAVILGDSRMAHFDMALVDEVSGEPFKNLAFGGASLSESIDLFDLALQANPNLTTCYFEVSFYSLRTGDARNRTGAIKKVIENPFAYLFNFNFNADMLDELLARLRGIQTGATRDEGKWTDADYLDENGAPLPYRKNLIAYADTIYGQCENYTVNEQNLAALVKIGETCREKGIRLVFVFPPVDASITDLVIHPLGIEDDLARIKSTLAATGAELRDFEYEPEALFTDQQFYDGFHLDVVRGLPDYTRILFAK